MLALNASLLEKFIDIFIKENFFQLDDETMKMIKYIQLPVSVSTHQNALFSNPQIASQQGNLFRVHNKTNDDELVEATVLKLMLVNCYTSESFITVNINDNMEVLDVRYSATYKAGQNRTRAKQHIANLLKDAQWITITDQYLTGAGWETSKNIISNIVPKRSLKINICSEPQITGQQKSELNAIGNDWDVRGIKFDRSRIHDRYIETDKFQILLSSGLLYLQENTKDFTYSIKLK